mmetsp:Transcript_119844/g.382567  ORF Transcript_119844/g.382567 Transcript_119844/m.382567 type:complete len:211 (-) Transcript_119844:1825-2457(-)
MTRSGDRGEAGASILGLSSPSPSPAFGVGPAADADTNEADAAGARASKAADSGRAASASEVATSMPISAAGSAKRAGEPANLSIRFPLEIELPAPSAKNSACASLDDLAAARSAHLALETATFAAISSAADAPSRRRASSDHAGEALLKSTRSAAVRKTVATVPCKGRWTSAAARSALQSAASFITSVSMVPVLDKFCRTATAPWAWKFW